MIRQYKCDFCGKDWGIDKSEIVEYNSKYYCKGECISEVKELHRMQEKKLALERVLDNISEEYKPLARKVFEIMDRRGIIAMKKKTLISGGIHCLVQEMKGEEIHFSQISKMYHCCNPSISKFYKETCSKLGSELPQIETA